MRRGLAWALTLPLVLLGTQAAHALAYGLVYPQARVQVLRATGHGYLAYAPLALALAGAVALAALCVAAVDAARGRPARKLPAWAFALLPPAMFVVQEVLELSLHTLAAGAVTGGAGDPPMHEPGSREIALVESGQVTLLCDGQRHALGAGDCVTFDADLPHHFENPGPEAAQLLAVVSAGLRRS